MIILPDIHGRNFWRQACQENPTEDILFLGDYVDPYPSEGIGPKEVIQNLKDILQFKREHPDNVTLLLGNHDFSYLTKYMECCRHDRKNASDIQKLLNANIPLFDLCATRKIGATTYLFTHAGVLEDWLGDYPDLSHDPVVFSEQMNAKLHAPNYLDQVLPYLAVVSRARGGYHTTASPVWADLSDHANISQVFPDTFQVFGHSQLVSDRPFSTRYWIDLDCRQAFRLTPDGQINLLYPPPPAEEEPEVEWMD